MKIYTERAGIVEPQYGRGQARAGLGPNVYGVEDFEGFVHWWYRKSDAKAIGEWIAGGGYECGCIELSAQQDRIPLRGKYLGATSSEEFKS